MDGGLTHAPLLMGIVNVTPDSFSDGGAHLDVGRAVAHGARLIAEGADWLDIGGESTRPGAAPVRAEVEIARVVPVLRALARAHPGVPLSIDTSKATVAAAAIDAGATIVNDVTALGDPEMPSLCAAAGVQVVLMHMRGDPRTMQLDTTYEDVVHEVASMLSASVARAVEAGVPQHRVLVDPGVGFGKSGADNLRLIRAIPTLHAIGCRVLIGASRKSFLGALTGVSEPAQRVYGSVGAALAAAALGADVLRVHDVGATRQALTVFQAVGVA